MKKALCFGLILGLVGVAYAAAPVVFTETGMALTRADPVAADGLALSRGVNGSGDVRGFRVVICAPSGQTITGGNMRCWYTGNNGLVARCGGQDWTPTTGKRCAESGDYAVDVSFGRVMFASDAITLSGGAAIDMTIEGFTY